MLVGAAFVAGFVDAIAGGGGLITVPALLLAGVPPVSAIATNKLQGTFGVASSTLTFWRAGRLEPALVLPLFGASFIGGVIGALIAHLAPSAVLRMAIPVILIAIALYVLASPKLGDQDAKPRMGILAFTLSFGLGIGIYDGLFGPGAGTFYLIGLILVCGLGMIRAIAHTKLMNFASNLGALIFFALAGHILVPLGLAMGAAAAAGAWLGARTTLRFGGTLVRPLVVVVSIAMALRLLLDPTHPVGIWVRTWLG
ncbi:MAG: hypothetical protein FD175_645 [Beijerinckiaceae bacterium]|nr:MAG: hypothetical protein FD175_645 [Beijerinckiaceae bacterium]